MVSSVGAANSGASAASSIGSTATSTAATQASGIANDAAFSATMQQLSSLQQKNQDESLQVQALMAQFKVPNQTASKEAQ